MANKFELDDGLKNGMAGNGNGHSALTVTDAALTLQDASVQDIYA